jgi:glycosyltransferase involved in cell wall biosynthesis
MTKNDSRVKKPYLVDVILPFHKNDFYLQQSIKSVLESVDVSLRLILVDVRTNDDSPLNLELSDNSIIIKSNRKNYGDALNLGLRHVSSSFVAIMNSDDIISQKKFVNQISVLIKNNADLSFTGFRKFQGKQVIPSLLGEFDVSKYDPKLLLLGSYGANATWLGTRDFWSDVKFTSYHPADWIAGMMYFPTKKIVGISEKLYKYRKHKDQITASSDYNRSTFINLYPYWVKLAKQFRFDNLSINQAALIAAPWSTQSNESTNYDARISLNWLINFNLNTEFNFRKIVRRRMLYISLKNKGSLVAFEALLRGGLIAFFEILIEKMNYALINLINTLKF